MVIVLKNDSLQREGVFVDTTFWDAEQETSVGQLIADMAKAHGVSHFVLLSADDCRQLVQEKYSVPHFESKAKIAEYCKKIGLPLTEIKVPFLMEDFLGVEKPVWHHEARFVFTIPIGEACIDLISAQDVAKIVSKVMDNPKVWIGKSLGLSAEKLTGKQMEEIFRKVLDDRETCYMPLEFDRYAALFPKAIDVACMYQFLGDFAGKAYNDELTKQLHPEIQSFEKWLQNNKHEFENNVGSKIRIDKVRGK